MDLVVSCYVTSFRWIFILEKYFGTIYLYFKDEVYDFEMIDILKANHTVVIEVLPNVGRCDDTFLHHIIKHREILHSFTLFSKDTLLLHKTRNMDFFNLKSFLETGSPQWFAIRQCRTKFTQSQQYQSVNYTAPYHKSKYKNLSHWYKNVIGSDLPTRILCQYGGNFCLSRDAILSNKPEIYEKCKISMSHANNCEESHFMERIWYHIHKAA